MNYIYNDKEMSAREIKALNQNVSYKNPIQLGAVAIMPTPKPECTDLQQVIRNGVEIDAKGNTVEKWKIVDKFTEFTNEEGKVVTKSEQELAYTTQLAEEKTKAARETMTNAVQTLVDNKAREFRWDDIKSARAGAGVPLEGTESDAEIAIHTEAVKLAKWDRAVWAKAGEIEASVLAGSRVIPTVGELLLELPIYEV